MLGLAAVGRAVALVPRHAAAAAAAPRHVARRVGRARTAVASTAAASMSTAQQPHWPVRPRPPTQRAQTSNLSPWGGKQRPTSDCRDKRRSPDSQTHRPQIYGRKHASCIASSLAADIGGEGGGESTRPRRR
eukprot:scaffold66804_cov65-Phaeocystis_antarctica.AAC.1